MNQCIMEELVTDIFCLQPGVGKYILKPNECSGLGSALSAVPGRPYLLTIVPCRNIVSMKIASFRGGLFLCLKFKGKRV